MTNIYIQSQGCSANLVEAQSMTGLLSEAGFRIVSEMESDVNILNICALSGNSAPLREIKKFSEQYPDKKLIVTGCITGDLIRPIRELNESASLINTHNIHRVVEAVEESLQGNILEALAHEQRIKDSLPKIKTNKIIGIIPIANGCADNCAYCSSKLVKGNIFSYPEAYVVDEVKKAVDDGCKEIWLTSEDNGAYGLDNNEYKLPALLNAILEKAPGNYKIRLGAANPRHVLAMIDELIAAYRDDRMFKFLHIPAESGNNEILGKMDRKYSVHDYKQIVEKFRRYIPDITIASDMIVGFPTETELQFQDSLHLIQDVKFDILNIARYSSMHKPAGAGMEGQVPVNIRNERSREMTELFERIALHKNRNWIGWEGSIIVDEKGKDNTMVGRNFAYEPVVVPGSCNLGQEVYVKILYATPYDLRGKVIEKTVGMDSSKGSFS
ncbi:tRNA (N(6)-L-threonylcarbamoyladenosine(37)-C(2))-methylthiotransferase [Candidatus Woesearchaeota archaeon]|nr:tRNA (N(6)-L-threonylcarbamoyladenosine(37)-C(2))-methylthiotransferase [Candidatus Woesearchaeota archaeon]